MSRGTLKVPLVVRGGVREDANPAAVPEGSLLSSSNVLWRTNQLRMRPGYALIDQVASADRIIGIGFHGSALDGDNAVIHTLTAAYHYDGSTFTDITGTWAASTATQPVRFAVWQQSGSLYIIRVNAANAPDQWDGGLGDFTDVTGSPPSSAVDILVAGGRVILIKPGGNAFRVQWSGFNDMNSWGVNDFADLKDTPGDCLAGRALGPNSFAVWKEDALYVGSLQAALSPFQFQFIARVPGPASASAITELNGYHYWLAIDGNIYRFDGSSKPESISAPISATLRRDVNVTERQRAWAFSLSTHDEEVWFGYLKTDSTATMQSVSINTQIDAQFNHVWTDEITAVAEWTSQTSMTIDQLTDISATIDGLSGFYPSIDSMTGAATRLALFGDASGNVYRFGSTYTDNGDEVAWEFTHGYKAPAPDGQRFYLDGIVSYWENTVESLTVTLSLTVTDTLGDNETPYTDTFDLATDSNHLATFPNVRGQWIKVKHSGTKLRSHIEHRGAAILAWPRKMY